MLRGGGVEASVSVLGFGLRAEDLFHVALFWAPGVGREFWGFGGASGLGSFEASKDSKVWGQGVGSVGF